MSSLGAPSQDWGEFKKDQSGKYKVRERRRRSPEDDRGGRTVPKPEAQKRNKVWRLLSLSFFLFFFAKLNWAVSKLEEVYCTGGDPAREGEHEKGAKQGRAETGNS